MERHSLSIHKVARYVVMLCLVPNLLQAVGISFVYNLRIAETTAQLECTEKHRNPFGVGATFITQERIKREANHTQRFTGCLGSLMYAPRCYYVRAEFGAAHVRDKTTDTTFSRTQSDDVLFLAGYTYSFSKKFRGTFSGLFGVPTHQDKNLEGLQFGYAHKGIGGQLDGSYTYSANQQYSLRSAFRYVHFLPRDVCRDGESFDYKIGDLIDVFIMQNCTWGKHVLELGYDAFWSVSPKITPYDALVIAKDTYARNILFATYRYKARDTAGILAGFSYAFDRGDRPFDCKRLYTFWASLLLRF